MKKKLLLLFPALLAVSLAGCNKNKDSDESKVHYTKVNEILDGSRIFEIEYDSVDYEGGDKFWAENNDNWDGGCSAVTKKVDNGHRVVGRNMDLFLSEKAAYIVRTKETQEHYRTLGLAYTHRGYSPDYQVVKEKGIDDEFKTILPFICDDVMNDQGLHIEVNMRHSEVDFQGNDQFSIKSTNPGQHRIHMFELPRYIAEHCKTVEEAKDLVNNKLDIYSKSNYWDYCFIISDSSADGSSQHSTLLEFSQIGMLGEIYNLLPTEMRKENIPEVNAINWIDEENVLAGKIDWLTVGTGESQKEYPMNALAQTNFYVNWWAYQRQDVKSGEGRFMTMQNLIGDVHNTDDMYDLMRRISYSYFYNDYDDVMTYHFDPRSENLGEFQGATYEFLFDAELNPIIKELLNAFISPIGQMSRQEKINDGTVWESTFTEVVDVTSRNIMVRFFENEDYRYLVSFDGTTKLDAKETRGLTDWDSLPAFPADK